MSHKEIIETTEQTKHHRIYHRLGVVLIQVQEHPNVGVYVKGLELVPCETKQDVMRNLANDFRCHVFLVIFLGIFGDFWM